MGEEIRKAGFMTPAFHKKTVFYTLTVKLTNSNKLTHIFVLLRSNS